MHMMGSVPRKGLPILRRLGLRPVVHTSTCRGAAGEDTRETLRPPISPDKKDVQCTSTAAKFKIKPP
jgi:hypothetical protein